MDEDVGVGEAAGATGATEEDCGDGAGVCSLIDDSDDGSFGGVGPSAGV